jgi:molybdopterin/thiamine biosynthesis adenylyltransferase
MGEGTLAAALKEAAFERAEGEREYECVSLQSIGTLASRFGMSTREVSAAALDSQIVPLRYVKNIGTVGIPGQARLLRSTVAVIGAGGIGSRAAELLSRMGVGRILLADPDVFDETNLNRQGFCCEPAVGLPKVGVVAERLAEINCDVEVTALQLAADADNTGEMLAGVDVVIDALDSFGDRLMLQEACRRLDVVMVHGAIAGTCVQITTIFPGDPGLEALIARGAPGEKGRGIELETGNPSTTPTLAAALQVQEAIKVILGTGETLRRRLLYLDLEDWTLEFIDL